MRNSFQKNKNFLCNAHLIDIGVAPRIGYKLRFPIWIPYWSGVTLFTEDGNFEDLTVEQAKVDPRLEGKRIFPESLHETIVEAQLYDQGTTSGWWRRPGQIRIPDLPGETKQPFLVKEGQGRWYYMTLTEPAGKALAIYRVYYIDAHSGERQVCEFKEDEGYIGPETAIETVKQIPGYKWVEKVGDKEEGNFDIIEPMPIPLRGRLFYKYTITTDNFVGVVETAVVDAKSKELLRFLKRSQFEAWLAGGSVPALTSNTTLSGERERILQGVNEVRILLQQAETQLGSLEAELQPKAP